MSGKRAGKTTAKILSEKDKLRLNPEAEALLFDYDDYTRVEHWYPDLEPITFPTTFIPMSRLQAKAITKSFENARMTRQARRMAAQLGVPFDEGKCTIPLSPELQMQYASLLGSLDEALATLVQDCEVGAFIKLSMRSPKDGAAQNKKTLNHLCRFLHATKPDQQENEEEWSRRALICYTRACSASLCIHSYVLIYFIVFLKYLHSHSVLIEPITFTQWSRRFRIVKFESKDL